MRRRVAVIAALITLLGGGLAAREARADEACPALAARTAAWVKRLTSADAPGRATARKALVRLGAPAVPLLLDALPDATDDGVRGDLIRTLGELRDPRARDVLIAVARNEAGPSEAAETRRAALIALGRLTGGIGSTEIRRHLRSSDPELRSAAREAALLLDGYRAVRALIEVLKAEDRRVQLRARDRLQEISGEALPLDADAWRRWWDDHRDLLLPGGEDEED